MNSEFGMYQGYNVESKSMEMSSAASPDMNKMDGCCSSMPGIVCPPVYECPKERCIHRNFVHEVPQDCRLLVIQGGISFVNVY